MFNDECDQEKLISDLVMIAADHGADREEAERVFRRLFYFAPKKTDRVFILAMNYNTAREFAYVNGWPPEKWSFASRENSRGHRDATVIEVAGWYGAVDCEYKQQIRDNFEGRGARFIYARLGDLVNV